MKVVADMIATATPRPSLALPVSEWLQISRERRALRRMTPDQRADLGIAPEAAAREARRAFWDLPAPR